jgi:hypothetical protein
MTDTEAKRLVLASLRNLRRAHRRTQTQAEVIERWLDRQILRKRKMSRASAANLTPQWDKFILHVTSSEQAMADFMATVVQISVW